MNPPPLLITGAQNAPMTLALAHGAGAPMDSPFMDWFAEALAGQELRVVRFEFPYMQERRSSDKRRPPNVAPVLMDAWRRVIDELGAGRLVIGGKSLGGRMASMVADEVQVRALVCLGYPFHAPGKPDKARVDHLRQLSTPTLICQGERDPFGKREEVSGYALSSHISVHWLSDGDHGFKPRKSSGRSEQQNWAEAADAVVAFIRGQGSRVTT